MVEYTGGSKKIRLVKWNIETLEVNYDSVDELYCFCNRLSTEFCSDVSSNIPVYLCFNQDHTKSDSLEYFEKSQIARKYGMNERSRVMVEYKEDDHLDGIYITTSLGEIMRNKWGDDLKYLCKKSENHSPLISKIIECSFSDLTELYQVFRNVTKKFPPIYSYVIPEWSSLVEGEYEYNGEIWSDASGRVISNQKDILFLKQIYLSEESFRDLLCFGKRDLRLLSSSLSVKCLVTGYHTSWVMANMLGILR